MERKTIEDLYLRLADQLKVLRDGKDNMAAQIHLLDQWNEVAGSLIDMLLTELARFKQQLDDRMEMQRACLSVAWNESTFAIYRQEQVAFCQRWLRQYRQLWMPEHQRCTVHLTTAQIVLLVRLARETEILPDVALKQSFSFVSAYMATQKQERLSYESLRKKYSEIDLKNLMAVRAILERLMKATDAHISQV